MFDPWVIQENHKNSKSDKEWFEVYKHTSVLVFHGNIDIARVDVIVIKRAFKGWNHSFRFKLDFWIAPNIEGYWKFLALVTRTVRTSCPSQSNSSLNLVFVQRIRSFHSFSNLCLWYVGCERVAAIWVSHKCKSIFFRSAGVFCVVTKIKVYLFSISACTPVPIKIFHTLKVEQTLLSQFVTWIVLLMFFEPLRIVLIVLVTSIVLLIWTWWRCWLNWSYRFWVIGVFLPWSSDSLRTSALSVSLACRLWLH